MLKEARHDFILNEVRIRNRVLLSDIAGHLNVSEDTVRRDLKDLHQQGKLKKVHGGAVAKSFTPFTIHQEDIYDHPNKEYIARKAVSKIRSGMVVLISGGTTNLELVLQIPQELQATFFTPSLQVGLQLAQLPNIETILVGGKISRGAQISYGTDAIHTLLQIRADICFLGTGHLDAKAGLTEFDWEVVQMKRAMIRAAREIISLTLSAKIDSVQRYQVCTTKEINTLVTELDPGNTMLAEFKKQGMEIL